MASCSKLKTLLLNSLPFPFLPAWSHPAASPGPAPAQQGQGRLAGTLGTRGGALCTPQSGPGALCIPQPPTAAPLPYREGAAEGLGAAPPSWGSTAPPRHHRGLPLCCGEHWGGGSPVPSRPAGCCRPSFAPAEDGFLARVLLAYAQPDEQPCLLVLLLLLDGPLRFILQLPPSLRARCRLQAQLLFDHLPQEGEWDQDDAEQDTGKGGRL